jgi:RNA polymerase sigma factor (sigma-70 family)
VHRAPLAGPELGTPEVDLKDLLGRLRSEADRIRLRYGVQREDAEDLLQQTLLAFVQKRSGIDCPEAWLLGAFRRECLMFLRRRQRRLYDAVDTTLLEACAPAHAPTQEQSQLLRDVESAIDRTPSRCRSLLRLRYRLGFATDEIAEKLGYRATSVRKIASRCLAALTRQVVGGAPTVDRAQGACRARF